MFISVEQFLDSRMAELLGDAKRVFAMFSTYNSVRGYMAGPVPGAPGLGIHIQSGGYNPTLDEIMFLAAAPLAMVPLAISTLHDPAREAQAKIVERVATIRTSLTKRGRLLVFIYGGLSAYKESVGFAVELRRELPSARVVMVTCDCSLRDKHHELDPLLRDETLAAVVETSECGGYDAMAQLLDGLRDNWRSRAA